MQILQLDSRKVIGTSGSGNQSKVWVDKNHLVKVNSKFRESSKEVDAYKLGSILGLNCAEYNEINVILHNSKRKACITKSFIQSGELEVTVASIFDSLDVVIPIKISAIDYINTTVEAIHRFTNLDIESIYSWIYDMLVFDYIICNNDRHLTNFELLYNKNTNSFRFAPYYDHGQSFIGTDATLSKMEYTKYERKFKSRPFSTNPDRNIGDYARAKNSLIKMLSSSNGLKGIEESSIGIEHKTIILRRIHRLMDILNKI